MQRKDNRRPQPNPRDKTYHALNHKNGQITIYRTDLFADSATGARGRIAIDHEGRVKVLAEPFLPTKDNPSRHIHPRHKRAA
jgi:hypothetical protein